MTRRKFNLKPVRTETTKDLVYKEIKNAILNGHISYNEIFTEVQLAELLNTSRTPVREAVQDLIKDGLIVPVPRKGLTVRKITDIELEQIFLLRTSIEKEVVKKLTNMITTDQLEQLKIICEQQMTAKQNNDDAEFIRLDQNFHFSLTRFVNYNLIEEVLNNLYELTRLIGLQAVKKKNRMEEVIEEHLAIVHAMENRDPERAAHWIVEHLKNTQESIKL